MLYDTELCGFFHPEHLPAFDLCVYDSNWGNHIG